MDDVLPVDDHVAAIGLEQPDDVFERDALSRSRSADDDDRFAACDLDRHIDEHLLLAEGFVDVSKGDHGQKRSFVRKKSLRRMISDALTTAAVVALPTPSAPPVVS
jgi:hypothetical protein